MNQDPPPYYPDCPILKDGYLIKRGGSRGGWKTWKRRWFVLDAQKQLAYFESVKAYARRKQPLGVLLVDRTFSARAGPVFAGVVADNECLFEVEIAEPTRKRVIVLKSETPSERREWLIALLKVQHLDLQSIFNPGSTSTTPAVVPRSITTPHASPLVTASRMASSPLVPVSRMPSNTGSSPSSFISVPDRPSDLYGFSPFKGYTNRMKALEARSATKPIVPPPMPLTNVSKEKALQVNDLLRDTEASPENSLSTTTPAAFFAASAAVFSAPLNTADDSEFSVFTSATSTTIGLPNDTTNHIASSSTLQPPPRGAPRYDSDDSMHSEGRLDTPFTPPPPPPKHISPIVAPSLKVSLTRNATTLGFSRGPISSGAGSQGGTSHSQAITFLAGVAADKTSSAAPPSSAGPGGAPSSFGSNGTLKDKTLILGGSASTKPAPTRALSMPRRSPDFGTLAAFANETREKIRNTPPMQVQRLQIGPGGPTRSRGDSNPRQPASAQSRALLKFKSEANLLRSESPVFYGSDQGYSSRLPRDQSAPVPSSKPPVARASSRNPTSILKKTSDAEFDARAVQAKRPIMALRSKSSHGLQKRPVQFYEPPSDDEPDSDPEHEEEDDQDTADATADTRTIEIPLGAKELHRAQSDYVVPNRYLRAQSVGSRVPSQQTTEDYRPAYNGAFSDTNSISSHPRSAYSAASGLDPDADWRQRPSASMLPRHAVDTNDFTFTSTTGARSSGNSSDNNKRDNRQRRPYAHHSEKAPFTRRRSEFTERPSLPVEFKGSIGSPEDDPVMKLPSGRLVFPNPSEVSKMSDSEFQMLLDSYMVAAKLSIQARRDAIANRE